MQPPVIGSNRVIFRELVPAFNLPSRHGLFARPMRTARRTLLPAWLIGSQRVSNWVLALSLASTFGLSAVASVAVISRPTEALPLVTTLTYTGFGASIPASKVLPIVGDSPVYPANQAAHAQIATLQGRAASMNSDLQRLRQDSATLRTATQRQADDVAAAHADLAGSEEGLLGQSQQLAGRLDATQQDVQIRLGTLDDQVASAGQLVNDVRKLMGLPAVSTTSVGGGQ